MINSESQIRVRYVETDAGGMVHHSSFIPWLELARVEMMDNLGLPYSSLEKQYKVHMAVLELHLKIIKPAYFDDRLTVKMYIKECPKVRLTIEYEILRNEALLATAETKHAFMGIGKGAAKPPKAFTDVLKTYF